MSFDGIILYKKSQTFTETIYQHLSSIKNLEEKSLLKLRYLDIDSIANLNIMQGFDCIVIHYSIRICYNQIPSIIENFLKSYKGTKVLFIQDEYDNTNEAIRKIKKLNFDIVFTCVPKNSIEKIYPSNMFPNTQFEGVLTSYCMEKDLNEFRKLSKSRDRKIVVGYRGRELALRYGELGKQKKELAIIFNQYCKKHKIPSNIKYKEENRIYGKNWYKFLSKCRASLGSESGCNIFDWEGDLDSKLNNLKINTEFSIEKNKSDYLKNYELKNCMNQISSRIFESINSRCALVLIEGNYSNILSPYKHYIPIKKDYSNLDKVFKDLQDFDFIDELTERTFNEISLSRKFSYSKFNAQVIDTIIKKIKIKSFKPKKLYIHYAEKKYLSNKPLRPLIIQNTLTFKIIKFISIFLFKIIRIISLIFNKIFNIKDKQKKDSFRSLMLSLLRIFNIL